MRTAAKPCFWRRSPAGKRWTFRLREAIPLLCICALTIPTEMLQTMCLLRSWRTFPFRSASASRKHLTCSVHAPQRRATSFTACRSYMRATAFMPIPASSPVTMLSWTTVHGHCATTKWHRFARTAFSSIEIICRKSGTPIFMCRPKIPVRSTSAFSKTAVRPR